jgi:hypothetical protein
VSRLLFPSKSDNDTVSVLISYLCVFAALFLTGRLAARGDASREGQLLAVTASCSRSVRFDGIVDTCGPAAS